MNLQFNNDVAIKYKNYSQRARVLTEKWVDDVIFCPNCGKYSIDKYPNNKPVADFYCTNCSEDYELKSKQKLIGSKIVDGAYKTMIERLVSNNNPNLFLLSYDLKNLEVIDFFVVPRYFFVPNIIEKRKPLSSTARRAGWIGCNIVLKSIPHTGKIYFVNDKQISSKEKVIADWNKTLFLREEKEILAKGWLLDIMRCIDDFGKKHFTLSEIYAYERTLSKLHPENKHIKDKIRQQLQILRERGYLEFVSRGNYRIV